MGVDKIALRLVIGGDSKGAKDALKGLGSESGKLGKGLKVMQGGAALGLTAIVGLGTKGVLEIKNVTAAVAGLQRQSKISAEDASRLVGQWQRYGVTTEAGSKATMILSKGIDAVNQKSKGSDATAEAFTRLGISLDDLKTKSPAEVLEAVRAKLSAMPPGAERTAIAAKLLGRGFMSMQKWIAASSTDIATLNKRLEDTGQVMSEEDLKRNKDLLRQQAEIGVELRGIYVQVGKAAIPFLRDFASGLNGALRVLTPMAPQLKYVAAGLAALLVVSKISAGINAMTGALRTLSGVASSARSVITGRGGGTGPGVGTVPGRGAASGSQAAGAEQRNTQAIERNTQARGRETAATNRQTAADDRSVAASNRDTAADTRSTAASNLDTAADRKSAAASGLAGTRVGTLGSKARGAAVPVGGLGTTSGKAKGSILGMDKATGKAVLGMAGLAAALAFTMNQLSKLGDAIDGMNAAATQAGQAKNNALKNAEAALARTEKKYGKDSPQYREMLKFIADLKAQIARDAYQMPAWAKAASKAKGAAGSAWKFLFGGGQAAGGDYLVTKPTLFLAGESGRERATFTPQGKAGPGGMVIHLGGIHIGQLNGTDDAAASAFANKVADLAAHRLRMAMATGF